MRSAAIVAIICGFGLSGCHTGDGPLLFGKVNTFGASISATAPDQGGNVVVGYRSANIAVVPVMARDSSGRVVRTTARLQGTAEDAFSTFAHFEASVGTPAKACLGDTFATGLAAQRIAQSLPAVCR
jgi:hypothetical protein